LIVLPLRHRAGDIENCRLKALAKAISDSYPTSAEICATERRLSRKRCAASCIRQRVRYVMGGIPISAVKRSAKAERER